MNISVVVPVYNGQDTIAACLESLLAQKPDGHELEIVVVDDGSRDNTAKIVSGFSGVRLLSQPRNAGPAAARNRGAREAIGDVVLFTDADCVPGEGWVSEMVGSFARDSSVAGVKGTYRTRQREITARFVQLEFEFKYERMKRRRTIAFIDTYSAGYRREIFLEAGGFDTGFPVASTEDIELSFRLAARGHRLIFNPNAFVYHRHPVSWTDFLKRKFKYAYWGAVVMRRYPDKVMNDSYTPLTQKLQMVMVPAGLTALGLTWLQPAVWKWAAVAAWVGVLSCMVPFMVNSFPKDWKVTVLSPAFLVPRALVQMAAVLAGGLRPLGGSLPAAVMKE